MLGVLSYLPLWEVLREVKALVAAVEDGLLASDESLSPLSLVEVHFKARIVYSLEFEGFDNVSILSVPSCQYVVCSKSNIGVLDFVETEILVLIFNS